MSSLLRSSFFNIQQLCRRKAISRYYSEPAHRIAQQKWKLEGVPRPRSILEDDDTPVDLSEDNEAVNGSHPNTPPAHLRSPPDKPTPPEYKAHRQALQKAFPDGWSPPRKLSREAMDALRQLNRTDPETFNTPVLADKFKISPEAVRRILKSRWEPGSEKRTALVVKERKQKDEIRQKVEAERASKRKLHGMDVADLRKVLRNDSYYKEKYGRSSEGKGVGPTDNLEFR